MNITDAIALKDISGVGDATVTKILKFASTREISTLEGLLEAGTSKSLIKGIPLALKEFLKARDFEIAREKAARNLEAWGAEDITIITLESDNYPKQLLGLDAPPPLLFCKGNLELLKYTLAIAVVGSRDNTRKGEQITKKTVEEFAKNGHSIVSGLALGIDTIAHRAAIECHAPTIAVLVDLVNISPASNRALANEILGKDGLLLSENPPGTKAIPAFFAKRDRIQAGLSTAVFAIETSIDGGTMHAVKAALSMKRPVYVPDAKSAGYPDLTIKAISGTQQLVNDQKATPYTRESYAMIGSQLEQIASQFGSASQQELAL